MSKDLRKKKKFNLNFGFKHVVDVDLPQQPEPIIHEVQIGEAKWYLTPGLHIVLGTANTGKTTLSRYIRDQLPEATAFLSFYEPESEHFGDEARFAELVAEGYSTDGGKQILVVDSLRRFAYSEYGATGPAGADISFLTALTEWHIQLRNLGLTMIAMVNPGLKDEKTADVFSALLMGSAGSLVVTTKPGTLELSQRYGDSREFRGVTWSKPEFTSEHIVVVESAEEKRELDLSDSPPVKSRTHF
jgi:hypothetical protein